MTQRAKLRSTAVGAVLGLVLVACGAASDPHRTTDATRVLATTPLDPGARFAAVEVPLSPRDGGLTLPIGDDVLVYGGTKVAPGSSANGRPTDSGATFDPASGTWTAIEAAGFPEPLLQVGGVWTGTEVIVLGTPCHAPQDDDGEGLSGCKPGGVWMGAFTPGTGKWRTRGPLADVPTGRGPGGLAITSIGLGWTGSEAVFLTSDNQNRQLLLFVSPTGETRMVATVERSDTTCMVDGRVFGVVTGRVEVGGGVAAPNPVAAAAPLRTYELDTKPLIWRELADTKKPNSADAFSERVYCNDGALAYLPVQPAPTGFGSGGLWFDGATAQWSQVPDFGPLGFPDVTIGTVADDRVLLVPGAMTRVLTPGASAWTEHPTPAGVREIVGHADDLLVALGPRSADGRYQLGFLDPARYR